MKVTQQSQLYISADALQIYDLLTTPSTLEPLTRRSIGKAHFINADADSDDRTFTWTYQFAGATLSTTATLDVQKPGQELGMHLSGDIKGYLHWQLYSAEERVRVVLSVDLQLPDGVIGRLTASFVRKQIDFELMLVLKNLRSLAEAHPQESVLSTFQIDEKV